MAVWSEVKVANLENFRDFSADYYKPLNLKLSTKLRAFNVDKIKKIAYVTDGEHGSPKWDNTSGIRYVTAEFIGPNFIRDGEMKTITKDQDERNKRARLKKGDILVYSVGAYAGYAARAEEHLFPANIPRSVAIIRLDNNAGLMPGFLSVFLNSKYGSFQTTRLRAGNSQPVLALEKIKQLEIPKVDILFQIEIDNLYEKAYKQRMLSKSLYTQAQKILNEELGLEKLLLDKPKSYEATFSEVVINGRVDAQCYKPDYIEYEKYLRKIGNFDYLRDVLFSAIKGQQAKPLEFGDIEYVSIKDIQGVEVYSGEFCIRSSKIRIAHKGDLLLAITGATIGKIGIVTRSNEVAFSGDILSLKTNGKINSYYLLAVLSNPIGQSQFQRWITGSTNGHLSPIDVNKIVIPRITSESEEEISNLLQLSITAKLESEKLLVEAKKRVENLIEG